MACPAAKDMSAVTVLGPGALPAAFQTLVQVAPPSMETSTSAVSPKPPSRKSLAKRIAAFPTDDRSIVGVTRYESSKKPQNPLSIAYGPEPPV